MPNPTLDEVDRDIADAEGRIQAIGEELKRLRSLRHELRERSDEEHFLRPVPGDFWHEMYSPVLIVLAVEDDFVTVCEKTKAVYETPDQAMVLKSYENPDDPEVRKYFARPRIETGYTFDLEAARRVSRPDFESMLKCYGGDMKDRLTYRCIPGRAAKFAELWLASVDRYVN